MNDTNSSLIAAESTNALGIDLLRILNRSDANTLWSPYSIQLALALAYGGAEGETQKEMARVLHYPLGAADIHGSFAALSDMLDATCRKSVAATARINRDLQKLLDHMHRENPEWLEDMKNYETAEPLALCVANRIFLQAGFDVREPFVNLLKSAHCVVFESLDFATNTAGAVKYINAWVEEQTQKRIRNLIPDNPLDPLTRIVLANVIYLKAPWQRRFEKIATRDLPFYLQTGETIQVSTMSGIVDAGFSKDEGFIILTLPYDQGDVQFVILMPDRIDGLAELTRNLNPKLLEECSTLASREMMIHLPKFRIEPPRMQLSKEFQALGMKTAFDIPGGSANFEGIAPRNENDYLKISEIYHKTFLELDEDGTEATAATAVTNCMGSAGSFACPEEVFIDRPFFFAIQHRVSGACLFLGYLADPSKH